MAKNFYFAVLTASLLSLAGESAVAGPMVGAGHNNNEAGVFQITNFNPPYLVTNPTGPGEFRSAVEFNTSGLGIGAFQDTQLIVRGFITANKTLEIHGYIGDGTVTAADLDGGTFIASQDLIATNGVVDIEFDITDALNDPDFRLQDGSVPDFLGFNLRETESEGGVVTLEYLVLGTFLGENGEVSVNQTQPVVPEPASMLIWCVLGMAAVGVLYLRRRRVSITTGACA